MVGTLQYMSPEQVRARDTDERSDIYSLGIVLYHMLTGRVPFERDNDYDLMRDHVKTAPPAPRDFAPEVPEAVEKVLLRSLAKKPEERFATTAEFRGALEEASGLVSTPRFATGERHASAALALASEERHTAPTRPLAADAAEALTTERPAHVEPPTTDDLAGWVEDTVEEPGSATTETMEALGQRGLALIETLGRRRAAALGGMLMLLLLAGLYALPHREAAETAGVTGAEPARGGTAAAVDPGTGTGASALGASLTGSLAGEGTPASEALMGTTGGTTDDPLGGIDGATAAAAAGSAGEAGSRADGASAGGSPGSGATASRAEPPKQTRSAAPAKSPSRAKAKPKPKPRSDTAKAAQPRTSGTPRRTKPNPPAEEGAPGWVIRR